MSKVSEAGMAALIAEKEKRSEDFKKLLSTPFNPASHEQINALNKYLTEFECTMNQMYLYEALRQGIKAWAGLWMITKIIPFPGELNILFPAFFYLGVMGYILDGFTTTNYTNQFIEITSLYNWCLKNNESTYDGRIDNTQVLSLPVIQKMVKLIAPLCSTEFMVVWPKVVNAPVVQPGYISWIVSSAVSVASTAATLFYKPSETASPDLLQLKMQVETKAFHLNTYGGFKHAIDYFISSTEFKDKIREQLNPVVKMVPEPIVAMGASVFKSHTQ